MRTFIAKLFGTSPFRPLQEHMEKARECVKLLPDLVDAFITGDAERINDLKARIGRLEHEADEIKNAIRDHIPRGMFLPVNRGDFMALLKVQDRFPDTVEDISIMMTLRDTRCPEFLAEPMRLFLDKVLESVYLAMDIIADMNSLLASSFSGPECEKVLGKIASLGHLEWEADNLQHEITRSIFKHEKEIDVISILFLNQIFRHLGSLANHAESIGDRMRVLIAS